MNSNRVIPFLVALLGILCACAPVSRPTVSTVEISAESVAPCTLQPDLILVADLASAAPSLWQLRDAGQLCAIGAHGSADWPRWHGEALRAAR